MGREKPEREEKEEEERSGKKVRSGLNAGSSAPGQGSICEKLKKRD